MPGSLTVLIVDDSAEDRVAFARYLRQAVDRAYSCIEAETAAQGLAMCQATPPDCVVLDYNLPDMDGLAFLDTVRGAGDAIPFAVVMITGTGDEELAVAALRRGAVDYLAKSRLSADDFRRAVRNAVEKAALQRELDSQLQRSTSILESITDAFLSLDPEWRLTYVNRAAERLLRRPRATLLGRSVWDEFPAAHDGSWFAEFQRAAATQTPAQFTASLQGGARWFDVRVYPAAIGLSVYMQDVTEQRRSEQILIESETRFRSTFDQAAVGMAHVGPDGRWLRVNRRLCEIVGYPQSELLQLTFQNITHPADVANDVELAERVLRGEIPTYSIEKRYIRKDGRLIWINLTVSLVRDAAGTPLYFISVVEDIDARKAASAKLQEREREAAFLAASGAALANSLALEATARTIVDLAVGEVAEFCMLDVADLTGVYVRLAVAHVDPGSSAVAAQLLRYPPRQGAATPLLAALGDGQPVLIPAVTDAQIAAVDTSPDYQAVLRALKLGSALVAPLLVHGQLLGMLTFARLIGSDPYSEADLPLLGEFARRAALAIENARLYAAAQEAVRLRETFLTVAAHELRTPLTTLSGTLELLRRRVAREEDLKLRLDRTLQIMSQQTQRLKTLTNTMLDSVSETSGQLELQQIPHDLIDIITVTLADLAPTLHQHTVQFTPDGPLLVSGDATRLQQALQHVLGNAVKYSPRGGTIDVTAEPRDGYAVVVVADQGMGVPAGALPFIFDRFYRGSNVNPLEISGFGIGLYLARQIVELHGGTIAAESVEHVGSRFVISLPLLARSPAAQAPPPK